jgi:hypothetical protein
MEKKKTYSDSLKNSSNTGTNFRRRKNQPVEQPKKSKLQVTNKNLFRI